MRVSSAFRSSLCCLVVLICVLALSQAVFAQTYYVKDIPGFDAYAPGVHTRESTHFRIIWGDGGDQSYMMTDAYVNGNLQMLENMWTEYYVNMGFKEPCESTIVALRDGRKYKQNLYVLRTGVPGTGTGGGAFCGFDGSIGFAFGIMEAGYLAYNPISGATPHEFGHFYENHAGGMHLDANGAWWECTANWMMLQFKHDYPGPAAMITMPYYYPGHGRNYYDHWQIWEYYKQTTGYGESFVNRVWSQGNDTEFILNAIMRLDTSSAPDKLVALKNSYGEVAKRAVTWDYTEHGSYFKTYDNYNMNLDQKYARGSFAQPVLESGSTTWYRCPWDVTPQQFGYTIIPLAMPGKTGSSWTVTANLKGLVDSGRGSDWRACLVAVSDTGTPRYSSLWSTGNNSITLASNENKLFMTVAATPSVQTINGFTKGQYRSAACAQFPFEISLTNAQPAEYSFTRPNVAYHAHTNGGGWVANSATVDSTAYVGPNATVMESAQVRGTARIEDYAVVGGSAIVRDSAVVSGHARVYGSAIVQNNAKVRDWANVFSSATISNDAKACEHAHIDNAKLSGYAVVKGTTYAWQDGTNLISGDSIWDGDTAWGGNTSHGIVFDWLPSGAYTTSNPNNLYCMYNFTTTHPYLAWDNYGVCHGYLMGAPTVVTDYKTDRGNELQLNGTSQWVELRSDVSDFKDYTVAIWARWAGGANDQRLISFGDGGSKQMYITPKDGTTGNARFVITDGTTTQYINGTAPLMTNGWQHVAVTISGNTGKLFVNGALVGTNTSLTLDPDKVRGANIYSAGCKNYIGRGNSGNYFNGRVDEFRVYSNAQTDATIATLGTGGETGSGGDQVAYYMFNETTGSVAYDSSGNAKNGTLLNGPTFVAGKYNNAVNLDGANDFVSLPNGLVSALNNFTIATWVKLDANTTWNRIFDFGSGTTTNMFLTPNSGTTIRYAITTSGGGGEQQINGTANLPTGSWQHVAVTLSGTTGILYVNGVEVGRNANMTLKPSNLGSTTQTWIGRSQYADPYFDGLLDEFKIYNRALSAAEVSGLYNSRSIPRTSDLLFSAVTDTFPASGNTGNWATYLPTGQTLTAMATPTVTTINNKKWESNLYADGDGYNYGSYASPIACNGASIVVAVQPIRNTTSTPWCSIVDAFYNNLVLGIHNDTGEICVYRNGTLSNTGAIIPNNQLTVLSLVVQSNGTYKVFANGTQIVNNTTTSTYTQIAPGVEAFMKNINVGRNNPDGWTTFNGNIGDVFFYKVALSDAERQQLEADIRTKFAF